MNIVLGMNGLCWVTPRSAAATAAALAAGNSSSMITAGQESAIGGAEDLYKNENDVNAEFLTASTLYNF